MSSAFHSPSATAFNTTDEAQAFNSDHGANLIIMQFGSSLAIHSLPYTLQVCLHYLHKE